MHNTLSLRFWSIISFIFLAGLSTGCFDQPSFPVEPFIEFEEIFITERVVQPGGGRQDRLTIRIKFQDGDGDLGLEEFERVDEDTLILSNGLPYPFQQNIPQPNDGFVTNAFFSNYFVDVLRQEGETFVPVEFPSPLLTFTGGFQQLFEEGAEEGPLEGTIDYRIIITPFTFQESDLLKFRIQIADRALNLSNVIETDTIRVLIPVPEPEP